MARFLSPLQGSDAFVGRCPSDESLGYYRSSLIRDSWPGGRFPGVKTDARDAEQLARLFRAGELTSVRVPEETDEAIRDLIRGRLSAVFDQRRARQRLKGFLLRLGFRYPGKTSWTPAYMNYLSKLKMPHPAQSPAAIICPAASPECPQKEIGRGGQCYSTRSA
jgi:hypothetical protein